MLGGALPLRLSARKQLGAVSKKPWHHAIAKYAYARRAHRTRALTAPCRASGGISARIAAGLRSAGGGGEAASASGAAGRGGIAERPGARARRASLEATSVAAAASEPVPPPPSVRGGRRGAVEVQQREESIRAMSELNALEHLTITDVLNPDPPFETDEYESSKDIDTGITGVSEMLVYDETGAPIDWPWETGETSRRHTGGKRRRHRLDGVIKTGLMASTADGSMGARKTGVRKWRSFCASEGTTAARPMSEGAPLASKLQEEWLCMRFVAALVSEDGVLPNTAAGYFGQVQGWHAKEYGVKLAAGMKLSRMPAMLKGLRRTIGEQGRAVRRGVAPQALRRAMDLCLDPSNVEHANIRAALSLALQGLLRGAEFTADGAFDRGRDLTRADVVCLTDERLVLLMRPCKNMHHLRGKTVPLIIGAGGEYIDAVAEMRNLFRVDPVARADAASTPLFRVGNTAGERKPLTTTHVRSWVKALMVSVGENPEQFGAHSLRIGGATALFAAGAEPTIIRTMGRWSSDIYRLYVRACFSQTLDWSRKAGSTQVHDVAQEFDEVDSY